MLGRAFARVARAAPLVATLFACAIAACSSSPAPAPKTFDKRTIDAAYRAEGVAVFDVDRDGHVDLVTDEAWYSGVDFAAHEIRALETYDAATSFGNGFGIYPQDVDGDGWTDIIVAPHPTSEMFWYQNSRAPDVHWNRYSIAAAGVAGLETPMVADIFGDGHPVLVMTDETHGMLGWFTPDGDPRNRWLLHPISAPGFAGAAGYVHGIGVGDVDGDGKMDVLTASAFFTQTSDASRWIEHAFEFGPSPRGCSRMFAYDVDGDGLADVICARPHDYGLHWLEQRRTSSGEATFVDHVIDDSISQMHALKLVDLDGDGAPEIVSGKRFWAHLEHGDPGVSDPALLVTWTIRKGSPGNPAFERRVIDDDSGIGTDFEIADVGGDGKLDIVVSNKKGLFVFTQR